jgi:hypothetical protein
MIDEPRDLSGADADVTAERDRRGSPAARPSWTSCLEKATHSMQSDYSRQCQAGSIVRSRILGRS